MRRLRVRAVRVMAVILLIGGLSIAGGGCRSAQPTFRWQATGERVTDAHLPAALPRDPYFRIVELRLRGNEETARGPQPFDVSYLVNAIGVQHEAFAPRFPGRA